MCVIFVKLDKLTRLTSIWFKQKIKRQGMHSFASYKYLFNDDAEVIGA